METGDFGGNALIVCGNRLKLVEFGGSYYYQYYCYYNYRCDDEVEEHLHAAVSLGLD